MCGRWWFSTKSVGILSKLRELLERPGKNRSAPTKFGLGVVFIIYCVIVNVLRDFGFDHIYEMYFRWDPLSVRFSCLESDGINKVFVDISQCTDSVGQRPRTRLFPQRIIKIQ